LTIGPRREYVASYPAGVLAFRMTANQSGKLNLGITLSRSKNVASNTASSSGGGNAITLKSNGGIAFTAEARVVNDGGMLAIPNASSSLVTDCRH
jgi:hypothetical protein